MTLTVRLPLKVEQELAEYCVARRISKSEAVKRALATMLSADAVARSPYVVGSDFFDPKTDEAGSVDLARDSKRLLRERFRGRQR